jgi:hypothetical protein
MGYEGTVADLAVVSTKPKKRPYVVAVGRYKTNAELIEAGAELGHLRANDRVVDLTYGKGIWWRRFQPKELTKVDLYDRSGGPDVLALDSRRLPAEWSGEFDAAAVDPDYGLRGTVNDTNGGYGLDLEYKAVQQRHDDMMVMLGQAARVARRRVLFKCQDQVCNRKLYWQTDMITKTAVHHGLVKIERLDMECGRAQPDHWRWHCLVCGRGDKNSVGPNHLCRTARALGHQLVDGEPRVWLERRKSPQEHAYERPSSLLIFEKR